MTIQEQMLEAINKELDNYEQRVTVQNIAQIAEQFALDFVAWKGTYYIEALKDVYVLKEMGSVVRYTTSELLEIFKKENGK